MFGIPLFAELGVYQGISKLANVWINFSYVAGHIAALIMISIHFISS